LLAECRKAAEAGELFVLFMHVEFSGGQGSGVNVFLIALGP